MHRITINSKEMGVDPISGTVLTSDMDIKWTGDEHFARHIYVLADRLGSFSLTEREEVLLKAIAVYSPGVRGFASIVET